MNKDKENYLCSDGEAFWHPLGFDTSKVKKAVDYNYPSDNLKKIEPDQGTPITEEWALEFSDVVYPSVDKRKARKTTIENKAATFAKAVNKVSKPLRLN